jgi:hypothetical protein
MIARTGLGLRTLAGLGGFATFGRLAGFGVLAAEVRRRKPKRLAGRAGSISSSVSISVASPPSSSLKVGATSNGWGMSAA